MSKRPMSRKALSALGGQARAKALSAAQRRKIARKAAFARWGKDHAARQAAYETAALPTPPAPQQETAK